VLVQPAGASFSAAYPHPPRRLTATAGQLRLFPGAQAATAYFVSPDPQDVIGTSSSPIPRTATFAVLQLSFGSSESAQAFVAKVGQAPGMKPVLVGDVAGYRVVTREAGPLNPPKTVRQPRAFESILAVADNTTVYLGLAVTKTRGPAQRFTRSVTVVAGAPAPLNGSAQPPIASQASPGSHSDSVSHLGRDTGVVLVLLLAIGLLVWYRQRNRRPGGWPAAGPAYGGPPHAGMPTGPTAPSTPSTNTQFAWLYQPPPGSGDILPGAPPTQPPPTQPPPT